MMILRSAPPSPFGRKVCIALSLLGLDRDVRVEAADTVDPHDSLREQNPLGKIPVLVAEDGSTFYDSRVILEYLDDRAGGGKVIPREAGPRFAALRLQALCDGILDASILTVYEGRWRAAEKREPKWLDHQASKVMRAFAVLEAARAYGALLYVTVLKSSSDETEVAVRPSQDGPARAGLLDEFLNHILDLSIRRKLGLD